MKINTQFTIQKRVQSNDIRSRKDLMVGQCYLGRWYGCRLICNNRKHHTRYFLNEKEIEKEKVFAEKLNGRLTVLGIIAGIGAYLTTGQIIPGYV